MNRIDADTLDRKHRIFDDPSFFLWDFLAPHMRAAREGAEKITERELWRDVWDAAVHDWCEMQREIDEEDARLDRKEN